MVLIAKRSVGGDAAQGPIVLVCTGGRSLLWPLARIEAQLLAVAAGRPVAALFHGACRGADALVDQAARRLGWPLRPMPARWSAHGASAGPIRNGAMLRAAAALAAGLPVPARVLLLALPGGRGTAHCVELAERLSRQQGLPIAVARIGE